MFSPLLSGTVTEVMPDGEYTVNDTLQKIKDKKGNETRLHFYRSGPYEIRDRLKKRLPATKPLITGQRVIDTLFPIAKGGTAAIPGGFGTGKTMTQHQLAKWCDADIIIYVGCGERGNEMSQVLKEFSELIDPKSQRPMTDRTVLIANTSNMPVAAREASIYTGITLGEYYRDMGYHTLLLWLTQHLVGLRLSVRFQDDLRKCLPKKVSLRIFRQDFPSSMSVGVVPKFSTALKVLNAYRCGFAEGSDFSEPVTQNTKRFTRCFWALDKSLAYSRHYPAINWTDSLQRVF